MTSISQFLATEFLHAHICSKSNTVISNIEGNMIMMLHGNPIAKLNSKGEVFFSDGGYPTNVTQSRLNAIAEVYGFTVFRSKGALTVGTDRKTAITIPTGWKRFFV